MAAQIHNHANRHLDIAADVSAALDNGQPVVALESTIICHGMPYPKNVDTALAVEQTVRRQGAVPATIAILEGRLKVGLTTCDINYLGKNAQGVIKCSRRDLPFAVAASMDGACTVAATMIIASMAGIRVFATGGIGGVHRGVTETMDVSADLEELARTNVAVVCAGIKSVLDIGRTLEYLETAGVPVASYQADALPAFYSRDSGFSPDYRFDTPAQVAAAMHAKWDMGLQGGMVIAVPVPAEHAIAADDIDAVISDALVDMRKSGISGKDATPYLLAEIAERTGGRSLEANIQLVLNNAQLAAQIAAEFAAL